MSKATQKSLAGFNLLRNDPEQAARLIELALAGDMDAQYATGLIYAEGRGVRPDLVQSYFWLTRAIEQGDADADQLRNIVGSQMSDQEFHKARHLLSVSTDGQRDVAAGGKKARPGKQLH